MDIILDKKLMKLIDELHENSAICYIVGGFVRDKILGNDSLDIDIEVHNIETITLEKIINKHSNFKLQGNFGVYILTDFDGVEIAIPRIENQIGVKHCDFLINLDPYMGTKAAAARRDFTCNTLMYNLRDNLYVDHYRAIDAIKNKELIHVSDKFCEDALRVYRALRFSSVLGFKINDETIALCKNINLDNLSKQRIATEFEKMMLGDYLVDALDDFQEIMGNRYGLVNLEKVIQNATYHPEGDVWSHTKEAIAVGQIIFKDDRPTERMIGLTSILFHDIGKINKLTDENTAHDEISVLMFKEFSGEIINNKKNESLISKIIEHHMYPRDIEFFDGEQILYFLKTFGDNLELFLKVTCADICGRYEQFDEIKIINQINEYNSIIIKRFIDLKNYHTLLLKTYNGNYFIKQGYNGSDIKSEQEKILAKLLLEFNRNWEENNEK